jgi:hypothetical protein
MGIGEGVSSVLLTPIRWNSQSKRQMVSDEPMFGRRGVDCRARRGSIVIAPSWLKIFSEPYHTLRKDKIFQI